MTCDSFPANLNSFLYLIRLGPTQLLADPSKARGFSPNTVLINEVKMIFLNPAAAV